MLSWFSEYGCLTQGSGTILQAEYFINTNRAVIHYSFLSSPIVGSKSSVFPSKDRWAYEVRRTEIIWFV
jgi:hypothetical protein